MTKLFVDSLTVMDFSYLHPERGLLGESWLLDIVLEGTLDAQGMVLDFGEIKQQVKRMVAASFDHKLLIPGRCRGLEMDEKHPGGALHYRCRSGFHIYHRGPAAASCRLDVEAITPESVATAIEAKLRPGLPENVSQIHIRLRPEAQDGCFYHLSHGLRHHAGNCQRIAHGHRSRIEILENGVRSSALEEAWAERWKDIYIGSRADLRQTRQRDGVTYHRFGYRAGQGEFELELPASRCYLIDSDSTVEQLAQHIAMTLKEKRPQACYEVRAFEGIGKGAIATV